MYILTEKDKAVVDKQVNDIAYGIESFKDFKRGAVAVLLDPDKVYAEDYADRVKEILCTTGVTAGVCNSCSQCERCSVFGAHNEAVEEIRAGKRHKPIYTRRSRGCITHVWYNAKKGELHIIQNM